MSFKYRFALFFSVSVLLILTMSALAIYLLNTRFQQSQFFKRLQEEAAESSIMYFAKGFTQPGAQKALEDNALNSLPEENIAIFDSAFNLIAAAPITYQPNIQQQLFNKAKRGNGYTYEAGKRQAVILYKTSPVKHYVVVSAYDKYGRGKAHNLVIILVFSVIGGLVVSALLSFFYIRQIIKPLNDLKQQMQKINEQNLTERLVVDENNDELTRIAKNFNDMLDRLEHAFETRKNFVQHASHELRTPLANMLSQTEAALSKSLSLQEYRDILQSLKEEQQDLISLTNSLLLLSQYENLTYLDTWKVMRIDELLYETIDITQTVFRNTIISVHFKEVPEDEEILLFKGNELLVKSAIQNLIRNACKYAEDDKVNITIDAQTSSITLWFDNVGEQLTAEEQQKLFIPFFRGENSNNKKGFGLGLSIVQRILFLHKAKVSYQAIAGNINRFVVEFPPR